MRRLHSIGWVAVLGALSSMGGCGSEQPLDTAGRAVPELTSARAIGRHYVELMFTGAVDTEAENPDAYVITDPNATPLAVLGVTIMDPDRTRVMLRTDAQRDVSYTVQIIEIDPAGAPGRESASASFLGSLREEVAITTAIPLSNTSLLLLTGSVADTALRKQDLRIDGLNVTRVDANDTERSAWIVTTTSQSDRSYRLELIGLAEGGNTVADPVNNSATFRGIADDDLTPPTIRRTTSLSATSVLVEFTEKVDIRGGNLKTTFQVNPRGSAVQLGVTQAQLQLEATHLLLTTATQAFGVEYELSVSASRRDDISDVAGNVYSEPSDATALTFFRAAAAPVLAGDVEPRLIGAISTGNTTVQIAFNKGMGDRALDPGNYVIVTTSVNAQAAGLSVTGARFMTTDRTDNGPLDRSRVELTTLSQSTVEYALTIIGVFDVDGKALGPARLTSDADGLVMVGGNDAVFAGTGATGVLPDTDGDGLLDAEEQLGWIVSVEGVGPPEIGADVSLREVTSDPTTPDTDGDGLTDMEESRFKSDPRDLDTDNDQVLDFDEVYMWGTGLTDQDSDDDSIGDVAELALFKTSPRLADTDGDGLLDNEEIPLSNRDPRIADLPDPGIQVGQVALRLDTRFAYTNTQGESSSVAKSTSSTLSQSESRTFATSDSSTNQHAIQVGAEGGYQNATGYFKASLSYGYTRSDTFSVSESSSQQTQEQYQESLTTNVARDFTQSVTRTVEGASVEMLVTVNNRGDIPFTIRNIELTGLLQNPFDRSSFLPVATLLPASALEGGGELEVALGPFIPERGPFIFKNAEVFPSLVEDLMKSPRGLIFRVANFNIVDEQGRDFAFITQDVNDRTVGLVIDFGTGEVDRFRASTHSPLDMNECTGASSNSGAFCRSDADCPGGACRFGDRRPKGVTMGFVLQDILGLAKNEPVNAITVGANGCGETSAIGDDVQVVVADCPPVPLNGTIIRPGPNGILDTIPAGDDHRDTQSGATIVDGGDGCAHTRAARDDVQVVPGSCETASPDGVMVLPGPDGVFQTVPGGDDELATVTGYGTEMIGVCDGNTVESVDPGPNLVLNTELAGDDVIEGSQILPGPNGIMESAPGGDDVLQRAGVQCGTDADCPGPGACKSVERLTRVRGVKNVPEQRRFWMILSPVTFPPDVDFDDLLLKSGNVLSLAYLQDRDGDGLPAREEFLYGSSDRDDNSDGCPFGDGAEGCDATVFDFDTIRDFEEVREGWSVDVEGQRGYFAFPNPVQPDSDADRLFDDEELTIGSDPGKRDTDEDEISDFDEVRGYEITDREGTLVRNVVPYQSARIVPGANAVLDTTVIPDDVVGTNPSGQPVITAGPNGRIDSKPDGDDVLEGTMLILDGGNGAPETAAQGDDVQVGPIPTDTTTATVTFVDFSPEGNACDGLQSGEFAFTLRVSKNVDTAIGAFSSSASVERFDTYDFTGDNRFELSLVPNDTITISGRILEADGQCGADTRRAVIEPGEVIVEPRTGGNGTADTQVPTDSTNLPTTDDIQEIPVGASVLPGQVVISPGLDGVLDTLVPGGDDVRPAGNGFADTLATGDDAQRRALAQPVMPGDIIVSCGPDGEPDMSMSPAVPGICEAFGGNPTRPPWACAPVIAQASGSAGVAESSVDGSTDDEQLIPVGSAAAAGTVIIGPGLNGVIDSVVASQVVVEPNGGNGTANTTAAGDDIQVVASGAAVAAGGLIIAPGANGVLDTSASDDDFVRAATDVLVPAIVPTGLDCSTCPLGDCVVNCGLCAAGFCVGDDVLLARSAGQSCEDDVCPCGTCVSGSQFDEWIFSTTLEADELNETNVIEFDSGPGCFATSTLRARVDVTVGIGVEPGAVLVRPGANGELDTEPDGDDVVGAVHLTHFATDPLNRDTDGDTLIDGAEAQLNANPNDPLDASKFRDNDLDGLANIVELDGWFVGYVDTTGLKCRTANGLFIQVDDESDPPIECEIITSDRFEPDTDFDGLPDLLEELIRSDPRDEDTDGDGILDLDEFDPGSRFSVDVSTFREFTRRCADADRCTFAPLDSAFGTSVVLADTDGDGRDDRAEIFDTFVILPCIGDEQLPLEVSSSPLSPDADRDGVPDGQEESQGTDPNDPDTDDDGKVDNPNVDAQPDGCGKIVTVSFREYRVVDDCDGAGGDGEFRFSFTITPPAPTPVCGFSQNNDDLDDRETHNFRSNQCIFLLRPGESFTIHGSAREADARGNRDELWTIGVHRYSFESLPTGLITISPRPGEANDGCFDGHALIVNIAATQG